MWNTEIVRTPGVSVRRSARVSVTLSKTIRFRHATTALCGAATLGLLTTTAGCSAIPPTQTAPSETRPSASSATRQNHAAASISKVARLPNGTRVVGPGTIYSGCSGGFADSDTVGEVFNPKTGQYAPIPVPAVPSGQKIIESACTVGGDQDSLRVYYLVKFLKPSAGLTPESTTSSIYAFDPFTPGMPQIAPWPEDGRTYRLMPTLYGFATESDKGLTGFDGKTLAATFTSRHPDGTNFAGFYIREGDQNVVFYSFKDGAEIGSSPKDMGTGIENFPNGNLVETQRKLKFFDFTSSKLIDLYDMNSDNHGFDMWDNTLLTLQTADHAATFIEVRNLAENKVLFSRQAAELKGLNIRGALLAGKYLYIFNDSDNPVIDISTAQKISSGWKTRPVQRVGRDWIGVVKDLDFNDQLTAGGVCEGLGTPSQGIDMCARGLSLVYAPNGDYPGPWF